jgi:hypothetical protein
MDIKPTSIAEEALVGFDLLTSLTATGDLLEINSNVFDTALKSLSLKTSYGNGYALSIDANLDSLDIDLLDAPSAFNCKMGAVNDLCIKGDIISAHCLSSTFVI